MQYPVCWDRERVRAVFTTESRQKARDLFLQTHRPFRRIRVDFCKDSARSGPFLEETDIRAIVQSGDLHADNRLFFVVGEAGSGKSELCQWLEYTVDRQLRLPVHIPRSMTSAAHVAAVLRQRLGSDAMAAMRRTPIARQAEYIALSAIVLLYEQEPPALQPAARWEQLLASAALQAELEAHLTAALANRTEHTLLPDPASLCAVCARAALVLPDAALHAIWSALRGLLLQAMEQTLWMGDLRALLTHLSEQVVAQGRRPLLLLEDVTAFRVLGDRLLDYLLDLTSGHFDAVIGVTTGFEQTKLAGATLAGDLTHIHHRLRGRFVLTDEQGRAYGLEEDVIDLARAYLRAVKPDCMLCPHAAACRIGFDPDLYPFTEVVLRRALQHLHEEGNPRQTPRLFLEHVLGAALLADQPPPVTLDRSVYLQVPPLLVRHDAVPDADTRSLLRWYGTVEDRQVVLDAQIANLWELPFPDALLQDGHLTIERAYVPAAAQIQGQATDWSTELRELQTWLHDGGIYPSREVLKSGIERVLLSLGDPRSFVSPDSLSVARAEIVYARGDERLPISLGRQSGDQPSTRAALKVRVDGAPDEHEILEELAYLSLSGAPLSQICRNPALTLEWAWQCWNAYHMAVRAYLTDILGGISPEHLVLAAWELLAGLRGVSATTRRDLRPYEATELPWDMQRHAECASAGRALARWAETVRRLFIGMFTLRDTMLDLTRYRAADQSFDRVATLAALARLRPLQLRSIAFRIRPTGQKLVDLLAALQRYAQALVSLPVATALKADYADIHACVGHLRDQQSLNLSALATHLAALRWRCGEVGVVWQVRWDADLEYVQHISASELARLLEQLQSLEQTMHESAEQPAPDVWVYQDLRHAMRPLVQHPYWRALNALREVQQELRRTAALRYTGRKGALANTRRYRVLLTILRTVRQEWLDAETNAD